jgi:nicotinic acid mononucleotide adenylyltransferase
VRPGFDLPPTLHQPMQKIIVLDQTPLLQISSTNIRKMVAEGKSISYLVPKEVQEEIEIQNYYKNNK